VVLTSPAAGQMKFPSGGIAPGHRVTVTAAGEATRLVVGVLLDAAPNDSGNLEKALRDAHQRLLAAGIPADTQLQAAADAGYFTSEDLAFAAREKAWVDVLVDARSAPHPAPHEGHYTKDAFHLDAATQQVTCPAGTLMHGPIKDMPGHVRYTGVGCATCPKKAACTSAGTRRIVLNWETEKARAAMHQRMQQPDAQARYKRRMSTVEPVFSNLEDALGFRRTSSRFEKTVRAEVLLKLLAHNVSRLLARRRLLCVFVRLPLPPRTTPSGAPEFAF